MSRVYGQPNPTLRYTTEGLVNGETAAEALTGELTTVTTQTSGVGVHRITQGTLSAVNYAITFAEGDLTVAPAPLCVVAHDKVRAHGAASPALTYTVSGLVNSDTEAETLRGMLATKAKASSPAGTYAITQGTLDAANYTITFVEGKLTVEASLEPRPYKLYLPLVRAASAFQ